MKKISRKSISNLHKNMKEYKGLNSIHKLLINLQKNMKSQRNRQNSWTRKKKYKIFRLLIDLSQKKPARKYPSHNWRMPSHYWRCWQNSLMRAFIRKKKNILRAGTMLASTHRNPSVWLCPPSTMCPNPATSTTSTRSSSSSTPTIEYWWLMTCRMTTLGKPWRNTLSTRRRVKRWQSRSTQKGKWPCPTFFMLQSPFASPMSYSLWLMGTITFSATKCSSYSMLSFPRMIPGLPTRTSSQSMEGLAILDPTLRMWSITCCLERHCLLLVIYGFFTQNY